jgi:DNA-binding response OmpR family regulator
MRLLAEHIMIDASTRIAELEERVACLKREIGILTEWKPPHDWHLNATEEKVAKLLRLHKQAYVPHEQIHFALYGDRADGGPPIDISHIWVCKLRPKLARFGIKIRTVWGRGYQWAEE